MFQTAVEEFQWDSEIQKEGFLNYVQFIRKFGIDITLPIYSHHVLIFLIQKQHEAAEYWQQTFATQVKDLQDQIMDLGQKYTDLQKLHQTLDLVVRAHQTILERDQK